MKTSISARFALVLFSSLLLLQGCAGETAGVSENAVSPPSSDGQNEQTADEDRPVLSRSAKTSDEEEPLELVLYYDSYNREYLDLLIGNFSEYYPEVTVLCRDYTDMSPREAKAQLAGELKNGTAPDLILDYVNAGHSSIPGTMHLLDNGEFLPLDRLNPDLADCNKTVLTCGEYRGTQYFLPANFSLGYLFTTDFHMTDLGILDGSKVTMGEFSGKIAQYYRDYPGNYAFPELFSSTYLLYHDGVSVFDPVTGELLPEDDLRRITEEYAGYYREGLFPDFLTSVDYSGATAAHNGSMTDAFRDGGLMFFTAPHFLGTLDTLMLFNRTYTLLNEAGETPLVFTLPTADGKAPCPMMNWYFAVNADTENTTAVKWFLENAVYCETQCQIGWRYGLPVSDYALDTIYTFYTGPDTYVRRQYLEIFPLYGEFSREFVDSYFDPIKAMKKTTFTDRTVMNGISNYAWEAERGEKTPDELWEDLWMQLEEYVNAE